jgi:hypothetical protein
VTFEVETRFSPEEPQQIRMQAHVGYLESNRPRIDGNVLGGDVGRERRPYPSYGQLHGEGFFEPLNEDPSDLVIGELPQEEGIE